MKGAFEYMKLDKIEKEMQRTRDKITDLQNRLKELGAQKTEQENLQIVSLVRSLDVSPADLKAFLQAAAEQPAPAPVTTTGYNSYTTEQEDSEDEE
jgi:predicted nuclease with TOPRIM domain